MSNPKWFKYEWIWEKPQGTNFLDARRKPYKVHENICVFSSGSCKYLPQYTKGLSYINGKRRGSKVYGNFNDKQELKTHGRLPRSIQRFNTEKGLHNTQKPVALIEYLIKTYTQEDELILDNTAGSGTLAIAAINTNRQYICIEKDEHYFEVMRNRIESHDPDATRSMRSTVSDEYVQLSLFGGS